MRDRAILPTLLYTGSVYHNIVRKYGLETGSTAEVNGLCVHSLRAAAATNALSHEGGYSQGPGMARPRQRLHQRLYDRRKMRPEDSPTFRVRY